MRRTTTARRRTTTKRRRRKASVNPIAVFDILGIALIFLCPILLIALWTNHSNGILGQYVAAVMQVSLGNCGAYIVSFLFALLGAIFIAGPLELIPRNIGLGSVMGFLDIVTWASLNKNIPVQDPASGGGYVGNALAWLLRKATGDVIGYWILALFAIIGAYFIIDIPLASLIDKVQGIWIEWRELAKEIAASRVGKPKVEPKGAKAELSKAVEERRARTLAGIFGGDRGGQSEQSGEEADVPVEAARPIVKINGALGEPPERIPRNGGTKEEVETDELGEEPEFQLPPATLLTEPLPPPMRVRASLGKTSRLSSVRLKSSRSRRV